MAGKLFQDDYDYGAVVREYYIDQMGQPYVRESSYEMMFHGPGDHIGTPGPLTGTREYNISFSQLRAAARTAGRNELGSGGQKRQPRQEEKEDAGAQIQRRMTAGRITGGSGRGPLFCRRSGAGGGL